MSELGVQAALSYLEKLAFGPMAADKVLKAAKRIQIRKGSTLGGYYAGSPPLNVLHTPLSKQLHNFGLRPEIVARTQEATNAQVALFQPYLRGNKATIFTPDKGDAAQNLRQEVTHALSASDSPQDVKEVAAKIQSRLKNINTPARHKMLEAVFKGHELAETQVKLNPNMVGFGHRSPEVMFREHNMITTMPKSMGPVKTLVKTLRGPSEATALKEVFPQFTYGSGQRLSRHARKHMTSLYDTHVRNKFPEGYL